MVEKLGGWSLIPKQGPIKRFDWLKTVTLITTLGGSRPILRLSVDFDHTDPEKSALYVGFY